ncbi:Bug family tripartite tricarboxylate transporter substrate binding protein [Variovorax sp. MHTC-1]|uniref:Bug family tripartite tricarboxylate transporter substrate binding protein n=1 Tax=Variovorax sp. MHTC-1 TaxID=2495593 RepID=UPI000F86D2F0|nr:tripartite tricarboxylate transporter substrate binding protein [Variovorax sp. MHTC-1]RST48106.1 tripartite tricarboxylate transporter substrate binding protein [Variovorax sp. MHTC-1]
MNASITRRTLIGGAAATILGGPLAARAQTYPSKLITMLNAFPAGGQADLAARTILPALQAQLGQTVIVENVAGVGGALGAQKLLSATPDGHTVLFGTPQELVQAPMAMVVAKYKPEDFRMVGLVVSTYLMLLVRPGLAANSVSELVALAKTSDRELSYGSNGRGSAYHLVAERFMKNTGVKLLHVPYKGAAQLLPDLVGGQIDMTFIALGGPIPGMIQKGQLKALAITAPQRHASFPNVPTMNETKLVSDFVFDLWGAVMVHKSTPDAVVVRLNTALNEVMQAPSTRRDLLASGLLPAGPMTPAEASQFYRNEIARYQAIGKTIDLQPE